jgi:hypothetical protein
VSRLPHRRRPTQSDKWHPQSDKDSIEDFGYGKGWVQLTEEFARFLGSLDALLARGMSVVFLAHATVKKFEAPDQAGSYDRFELKLSKQTAPLLKEWADLVLFANYVTKIAEKDNGNQRRSSTRRYIRMLQQFQRHLGVRGYWRRN